VTAEPEIIVAREGRLGRLTLNRPKALGALTLGMCQSMTAALLQWREEDSVSAVLIDHAGERGFCAGGDIRFLAESAAAGGGGARTFYAIEYRLNHLMAAYERPIIALMDGIVMGGGVGITDPARYRVATERTRLAMPETNIGFFPDVGGGWFLPKLPGRSGLWLALTSARMDGADCKHLGQATHYVPSVRVDALKAALSREPDAVDRILDEFDADPGAAAIDAQFGDIDRLFAGDTVEAIVAALEADGSDWAKAQLAAMAPKCPVSAKVSHRLITGAPSPSFAADLELEYRLAIRLVMRDDFAEGVRAVIVEKDNNPHWRPATLAEASDTLIDELFAPLPKDEAWTPLPGFEA
jgi:enoyl-CoA hydratase